MNHAGAIPIRIPQGHPITTEFLIVGAGAEKGSKETSLTEEQVLPKRGTKMAKKQWIEGSSGVRKKGLVVPMDAGQWSHS